MKTNIPLSDFLNNGYTLYKGARLFAVDDKTEYIYDSVKPGLGHVCHAMGLESVPLPHPQTMLIEVEIEITVVQDELEIIKHFKEI